MKNNKPSYVSNKTVKVEKCPYCKEELIEKRNTQTGELFLGCPNYPHCSWTKPYSSSGCK